MRDFVRIGVLNGLKFIMHSEISIVEQFPHEWILGNKINDIFEGHPLRWTASTTVRVFCQSEYILRCRSSTYLAYPPTFAQSARIWSVIKSASWSDKVQGHLSPTLSSKHLLIRSLTAFNPKPCLCATTSTFFSTQFATFPHKWPTVRPGPGTFVIMVSEV